MNEPSPANSVAVTYLKLCESLQQELRNLSSETRRKFPQIKEASDGCVKKLRDIANAKDTRAEFIFNNMEIVRPFLMGCGTKVPKAVVISLSGLQKMITCQAIGEEAAAALVSTLWTLMESGIEELKLLQTAILLITTNSVVKDQHLAKALVLCFRLHFTKNSNTVNTAAATIRQCTHAVFERVMQHHTMRLNGEGQPTAEERGKLFLSLAGSPPETGSGNRNGGPVLGMALMAPSEDGMELSTSRERGRLLDSDNFAIDLSGNRDEISRHAPTVDLSMLSAPARDAYHLFKDICLLVDGEQAVWLQGMKEMSPTLGIEIIESILTSHPQLFRENAYFISLLHESVTPILVKLFSSSLKATTTGLVFPLMCRLFRLLHAVIINFYYLMRKECEVFFTYLLRFLDFEKMPWQRTLTLEVLHKCCSSPTLLSYLCENYDMREHSSHIFQEVVTQLGAHIRVSLLARTETNGGSTATNLSASNVGGLPVSSSTVPAGGGSPAVGSGAAIAGPTKSCFVSGSMAFPVHLNLKTSFVEMMDKMEAPTPPEGYNVSVAFLALMEVVRSLQRIVDSAEQRQQQLASPLPMTSQQRPLQLCLINSSWHVVLTTFNLLLECSCDESATEAILRVAQNMISLCGSLDCGTQRDAFVTSLCRAALPRNYASTLLRLAKVSIQSLTATGNVSGTTDEKEVDESSSSPSSQDRSQVVVVGSSGLPVLGLPTGLGPILLTAKNLQCMLAILSLTHCHGAVLENSWYLVLATLQQLVWILALKFSLSNDTNEKTTASVTVGNGLVNNNSMNNVVNPALLAELPIYTAMVSRLFESSRFLSDDALEYLVEALCRLAHESVEVADGNKEPSLFPVAKLMETAQVNVFRLKLWWQPVSRQLLEICHCPHTQLRQLGATSLLTVVRGAMICSKFEPPFWENQTLYKLVLEPFSQLNTVSYQDVRQQQFETVHHILDNFGHLINNSWTVILNVMAAIGSNLSGDLIRFAYQTAQTVIGNFLDELSPPCYVDLVDVLTQFALQTQEEEISLAAIHAMWTISVFFHQEWEKSRDVAASSRRDNSTVSSSSSSKFMERLDILFSRQTSTSVTSNAILPEDDLHQVLWLCLVARLAHLAASEERAPVRDAAIVTLFKNIEIHGNVFTSHSWKVVLWKVIFPMLETVEKRSEASDCHKSWSDTQVTGLLGLAQLFSADSTAPLLRKLGEFGQAWKWMVEFVQRQALRPHSSISVAALRSLHDLYREGSASVEDDLLWINWGCWRDVAVRATTPPNSREGSHNHWHSTNYLPSQKFLTLLIELGVTVMGSVAHRVQQEDVEMFFLAVRQSLFVPLTPEDLGKVARTARSSIGTLKGDAPMTELQEAALKAVRWLVKRSQDGPPNLRDQQATVFLHMTDLVQFSWHAPPVVNQRKVPSGEDGQGSFNLALSFVTFGEQCMRGVTELFEECAAEKRLVEAGVLDEILRAVGQPLSVKYNCPSQSTWKLAFTCLISLINAGVPVARTQEKLSQQMWRTLADVIRDFLFCQVKYPAALSMEEFLSHEELDCKLIRVIRDQFLATPEGVPLTFIQAMVGLLQRGSVHSASARRLTELENGSPFFNSCGESEGFREHFAELCFETLLKFVRGVADEEVTSGLSVNNSIRFPSKGGTQLEETVKEAAVLATLQRCSTVLQTFVEDSKLAGETPLPRARLVELGLALKALRMLLQGVKRVPRSKVSTCEWDGVVTLYPLVVECVLCSPLGSPWVASMRTVLHEYTDMMRL